MGKALFGILRLFGPARILQRMRTSLRAGNNYIEGTLEERGPNHFVLGINECNGSPGYVQGVIEAGLTLTGTKTATVVPRDFDGHRANFEIRW